MQKGMFLSLQLKEITAMICVKWKRMILKASWDCTEKWRAILENTHVEHEKNKLKIQLRESGEDKSKFKAKQAS